jgi:hypothetical protein
MERHIATCRVCGACNWVRHIDLYVSGSEGLDACEICEMSIVEYVRGLILIAGIARKEGYKACRQKIEAS